ncbi:unnamed protein product [Protopolystoma xenopodis]|uniref:Uncharacterized protein n=1 Tax=Protopolystoma xenopodis TaxID=117903 RepID=A0A448X2W2_9PLAT|nr:unnamed protein product [Protopolystoma xenopodis]
MPPLLAVLGLSHFCDCHLGHSRLSANLSSDESLPDALSQSAACSRAITTYRQSEGVSKLGDQWCLGE